METGSYVRGDLAILEAGFAALEQAVLVHDSEGKIVACNPAAAKLAGRPVDEILGRGAGEYEHEARFKDGTPITRENSRLLRCIRTGKPERDVLVELRTRSGEIKWVRANYQPLVHEGEERPWGAVSSAVPVRSGASPYEALNDFTPQLQALLEAGEALLYLKDLDGRYTFMNRRLGRVLGVCRDQVRGKTDHDIRPGELADACVESDRRSLESRSAVMVEERFGSTPETPIVRTIKFPLLDEGGKPYALAGLSVEVSPLERRGEDLQLESAPAALLSVDGEGRVSFANRDARALASQCDNLQLAIDGGERLADLLDDDDVTVEAAIEAGQRLSLTRSFERPDGDEMWLAIEVVPHDDGSGAMCSLRDVTKEREREEELSHLALHDSLTGLPNRRFTEEQLALGLARARRQRGGLGVVFLDIDNFKRVNDELGHAAGDEVLIEFAERLTGALRETDAIGRVAEPTPVVARRGGDEFVLLLTDLPAHCAEQLAGVIARVEAALAAPFKVGSHRRQVTASVGAAAYPYDSQDPAMLVELANAGMRQAKRRRR